MVARVRKLAAAIVRGGLRALATSAVLVGGLLALSMCTSQSSGCPDCPPEAMPGWHLHYVSDCNGGDFAATTGSDHPDSAYCGDHSQEGTLAVCWDQTTYTNAEMAGPWCTYKAPPGNTCNGGSNVGLVYICYQPPP
jgi:hypothetical protein